MAEKNKLNLFLFGDGGTGAGSAASGATSQGAAAPASGETSEKGEPVYRTKRGTPIYDTSKTKKPSQAAADTSPEKPAETEPETFESLVKGKYKAEYDANVQSIVQGRLKSSKGAEETLGKVSPVLEALGKRYGIDTADPAKVDFTALAKSIVTDPKYLEEEALTKGKNPEEIAQLKALEFDNERLKREAAETVQETIRRKNYESFMAQASEVSAKYPGFDIRAEMKNPQFVNLTKNHVPVEAAYKVIHHDEIVKAESEKAAKAAQEMISKSIQSGAARPIENGVTTQHAGITKEDITSKEYREQLKAQARRGQKVII